MSDERAYQDGYDDGHRDGYTEGRQDSPPPASGPDLENLPEVQLAAGAVPALDHLGPGRHLVWAVVAPPKW